MKTSEARQHRGLIRLYPQTHEEIKRHAEAMGVPMAGLLETAWGEYKKRQEEKACRYCGVKMAGSKDVGSGHLPSCPLHA